MSKTDSGGTTSYNRAGAYVTDSLLKSTVSSTTTDYTPGVSSFDGTTNRFMHSGIKNADEQTGNNGAIAASRQYDAFGSLVSSNQTWQGPLCYGGPYGYQTDGDHGLMLLGHRYYEADTGRFLTRDPIKDGRNWYGYCGNDPVNSADATGGQRKRIYGENRNKMGAAYDFVYHVGTPKRGGIMDFIHKLGGLKYSPIYSARIDYSLGADAEWRRGKLLLSNRLFDGWSVVPGGFKSPATNRLDAIKTFRGKAWLASVLVHEYDHLLHDETFWGFPLGIGAGAAERRAWGCQIEFLELLVPMYKGDAKRSQVIRELIEDAAARRDSK